MATVRFTQSIQRHVECPTREVEGATLRDVLEAYLAGNERARGYVLDDQGRLRKHMAIFIDGRQIGDRLHLTDPVAERRDDRFGAGAVGRREMSTRCHVATRKGLFTIERESRGWAITRANFLGDNVTLVMHDPRTGSLFAALNHGHFGTRCIARATAARRGRKSRRRNIQRSPRTTCRRLRLPKARRPTGRSSWSGRLRLAAKTAGGHLVRHAARRTFSIGR